MRVRVSITARLDVGIEGGAGGESTGAARRRLHHGQLGRRRVDAGDAAGHALEEAADLPTQS